MPKWRALHDDLQSLDFILDAEKSAEGAFELGRTMKEAHMAMNIAGRKGRD